MEVIKPKENGAIRICNCCGNILNFNGEDVKIEKKQLMFKRRFITCPVCKCELTLD